MNYLRDATDFAVTARNRIEDAEHEAGLPDELNIRLGDVCGT